MGRSGVLCFCLMVVALELYCCFLDAERTFFKAPLKHVSVGESKNWL